MAGFWEKLSRIDGTSDTGRVVFLAMIMGLATVASVFDALLAMNWIPIYAALAGWAFVAVYALAQGTIGHRSGTAVASIVVPSGNSTPSVAQHSNIETLEIRGEYEKAKDAYLQVIRDNPEDLVACEKLAQLAFRQLKDYETAVWAYHQAELRSPEPRRRMGYAMLAISIVRDNVGDSGRTLVELRKLLERYPDLPNADELRAELAELKVRHFEGS